jgi:uracil-DNA glycosylase family 4
MISRPAECAGCPLNTRSAPGFCPDVIPEHAEYLLQGEAPGDNERKQGKPFIGKAGFVLENWIVQAVPKLKLAWDQHKVGLVNTLRCLPPKVGGRAYPQGDTRRAAERHCRRYDVVPTTVHTIVLFGEHAQRLHFAKELEIEDTHDKSIGRTVKGVMGRVGRVYERQGRRYVFCVHPAAVLRQPALVAHAQEAMRIAAKTAPFYEPTYEPWAAAVKEMLS